MATLTTLLKDYQSKDGTRQIVIRVEHAGRQRLLPVGYKVKESQWENGQVVRHPDRSVINSAIASLEAEIKRYLADCSLHGKPIYLDLIGTGRTSYSFTEYLDGRAAQYREFEKIVMQQKVSRFALELRTCFGREVYFEDINLGTLRQLEEFQIKQGNVENTRAKKFKFLREFYGHAIKEGKAPSPNPFKDYKIVGKPVKKDKLSEAEIKRLEDLQLASGPVNDARNLFLFSFYAKGQRFEVCATLRREQVRQGRIFFRTNKGNDYISVKIHERLQVILDQYPAAEFVFPFVKTIPEGRKAYLSMIASQNTVVNSNLKIVGALAKLSIPLTMHLARHTFAYQLKKVTDSIHVIQDSLGHSDQRTTQIYLKALDDEILDKEMEKLYGK